LFNLADKTCSDKEEEHETPYIDKKKCLLLRAGRKKKILRIGRSRSRRREREREGRPLDSRRLIIYELA